MEPTTVETFAPSRKSPLLGLPCLPAKVSLFIPTTMHDKPAPAQVVKDQRERVAEAFSRYFGGFNEVEGRGGWYSEQLHCLIVEEVYIVSAHASPAALAKCLPAIINLAALIGLTMKQEAVSLEVDGKLYFIGSLAQVA